MTTTDRPSEDRELLEQIARNVALSLQRMDTLISGDASLLGSRVSRSCSGNSNGCEIHCQTLAGPGQAT